MQLADITPEAQQRIAALEAEIRYLKGGAAHLPAPAAVSERAASAASASVGVGAWSCDADGDVVRGDARFAALSGIAPEVIAAGLPIAAFIETIHADDKAATETALRAALRDGGKFVAEYRVAHGGAQRWIVVEACHEMDGGGAPRFAGVAMDVTGPRLVEEQLRQSQKMEAIGKLTGGVAHDFNNILQVISGNLQMLASAHAGDALTTRRLAATMDAVERGARLSSQLLSFARSRPLHPTVLHLPEVLRKFDAMLRRTLGETIVIETRVAADLWPTLADAGQLENTLLNIALNSRDAMQGAHGGKLTIDMSNAVIDQRYASAHGELLPGDYVAIAISDTGGGMSAETAARAFDPFFTTKPVGQGSGLGLSMAYGFVRQSAGHIEIRSEAGDGTTVKLYLPRGEGEGDGRRAGAEQASATPAAIAGGSETILVVEDDLQVQDTVSEVLGSLGYRVLRANDGAGALAILRSGVHIDLLFTDVIMPGAVRTPDLAGLARELSPGIEILFTSGYTENAVVHGGPLDLSDALIRKPYRQEDLARKIRAALDRPREPAAAAEPDSGAVDSGDVAAAAPPSEPAAQRRAVLVVEDMEDARLLACELIDFLGHETAGAASAEDALTLLAARRFDVLLTDIKLPGMSGNRLAEHVASRYPGIKIVFASGYGARLRISSDIDSTFLPKPYDLEQLKKALE
jgi:signal transduction histidine kinase/DNA-binding response OmpR family regulator